jgi:hypothetical protein
MSNPMWGMWWGGFLVGVGLTLSMAALFLMLVL